MSGSSSNARFRTPTTDWRSSRVIFRVPDACTSLLTASSFLLPQFNRVGMRVVDPRAHVNERYGAIPQTRDVVLAPRSGGPLRSGRPLPMYAYGTAASGRAQHERRHWCEAQRGGCLGGDARTR